jgi:hypothetical protein
MHQPLTSARIGRPTAAVALAVCALAVGTTTIADGARAQGGSPHVLVATTGNDSELRESIPITRTSGKKPRVVMSMGPDRLPSLDGGDRLKATGEVEVTTDCAEKMPRCVGKPYSYNPIVGARIVLADGPFVTGGENALELGTNRTKCRQKPPDREHHCVLVFTNAALDIADRGQLPCAPGSCHLNLVVEAHNAKKKKGKKGRRNKLLIGEDEPDGRVVGDSGRLNAIRFEPANQPAVPPVVASTPLTTAAPVTKGNRVVVFSQQLNGLEKGDQLAVNALMNTSIAHLPYVVLVKSRVILGLSPTSTGPGKAVKQATDPPGEITEGNGFNCTQREPQCVTNKVGVITLTRNPKDDAGDPIPLYANLILNTAKPGDTAPAGDTLQILPGGGLAVTRYPASLNG